MYVCVLSGCGGRYSNQKVNTYLVPKPIQGSRVKLCTDFLIGCPVRGSQFFPVHAMMQAWKNTASLTMDNGQGM